MRWLVIGASAVLGVLACFLLWWGLGKATFDGNGWQSFGQAAAAFALGFAALASWLLPKGPRKCDTGSPCYCKGIAGDCGACDGTCGQCPLKAGQTVRRSWRKGWALKSVVLVLWPCFAALFLAAVAIALAMIWFVFPFVEMHFQDGKLVCGTAKDPRPDADPHTGEVSPKQQGEAGEWKAPPAHSA